MRGCRALEEASTPSRCMGNPDQAATSFFGQSVERVAAVEEFNESGLSLPDASTTTYSLVR